MTREETIEMMIKKANEIYGNGWTRDGEDEIWSICSDWNSEHGEDEEIFMCEHENEETGLVDGFYIEDDSWAFEDRD
jgi:hypothetical protein